MKAKVIIEHGEDRTQWFLDRIGKRVFRNKDGCNCPSCLNVAEQGIVIASEEHARYLDMIEATPDMEIKYFDTMEEALIGKPFKYVEE